MTISAGDAGAGNGSVAYTVASNPGAIARTGTLTIGGQTFTLTQAAPTGQTIQYRIVPLTEIPSAQTSCVPTAINEKGDVVGYCAAGEPGYFAVRWRRDGTVEDLGRLQGGLFSCARGINFSGQVVGDGDNGDLIAKALISGAAGWNEIDNPDQGVSRAIGITDGGTIFGNFTTQGGSTSTSDWNAAYWAYNATDARYDRFNLAKPSGTPITGFSGAYVFAANRFGTAAGQVASDLVGNRAALWDDASHSLVVLDSPSGLASAAAYGVSDDGRAAGVAYGAAGSERAVLWQNDAGHTPVNLGTLAGDLKSVAYGVNNAGQVVGVSIDSSNVSRGFIHHNDTLTGLTTLLGAAESGWTIDEPAGINNTGEIVATGTAANGLRRPVMLVPTITSVTLTADRSAPQVPGTSVTFTAAARGGTAAHQFKWLLYDGTTWAVLQGWSTAASFTWTPAIANASYYVAVVARGAGNTTDAFEQAAGMSFSIVSGMTGVTLTASLGASQLPGTAITFTAAATGGAAPIQFKWLLYDGTTWTVLQGWSPAASFTWTPSTANASYYIAVVARSAGNTTDQFEQAAGMSFPIVGSVLTGLTLTSDLAAPQPPSTGITFTAAATGGAGAQFKWLFYDGTTWTVLQNWSTAASITWTPAVANANAYIAVVARSAGNTTDRFEQAVGRSFPILNAP
jgi:probable HAF family extracellular repeat protein